jgi:hypothetical protein
MVEYKNFIMKMWEGLIHNGGIARFNMSKLLDIELILGFNCILPLLEFIPMLIKYAQG